MRRGPWMAVIAVSAGVLAGCGGEAPARSSQGIEEGGRVHRSSVGREGLESDLRYFKERLAALEAEEQRDAQAISSISGLVAHLEGLRPNPRQPSTLEDTCGVSYYSLSATVNPGYSVGSATADASFVEFGPPSPWSKTLFTQAWGQNSAGTRYDSHSDTYTPPGTFSEPTAYIQTPASYSCKRLSAYASITANGCSFYAAESDDYDSCQF